MRLLGAKYKTYEGARKRAAFENGVAPGEYRRGDKAYLYNYTVERVEDFYRVARWRSLPTNLALASKVKGTQP